MKVQLTRDRVRLQNQMECLLEEMRIKLSFVVSYWVPVGVTFCMLWRKARAIPRGLQSWGGHEFRYTAG